MSQKTFMPRTDLKKAVWLKNIADNIDKFAAKYGISEDEKKFLKDAAIFFLFWINYLNEVDEFIKQVTAYKNALRNGIPPGAVAPVVPDPPAPGAIPPAVDPDIFGRASSIGQRIKKHNNYTKADGEALGLEGAEIDMPDLKTVKPAIQVVIGNGGHPDIIWIKGLMDALKIMVNRGTGWQWLAVDSFPDYTDTAALPATGQSALWLYKAIYIFEDEEVGQWSDEVSISVKGV